MGLHISFWSYKWSGGLTIRDEFPRLFQVATNKEALVSGMALVVDNSIKL